MTTFATWFDVGDVNYILYYNDLLLNPFQQVVIATPNDPVDLTQGFNEVCTEEWIPLYGGYGGYLFAELFFVPGQSQPYFLCYQQAIGSSYPGFLSIRTLKDPGDPSKGTQAIWTAPNTDWQAVITVGAAFYSPYPDRLYFVLHMGNLLNNVTSTFITKLVDDSDPSMGILNQSQALWSSPAGSPWNSGYVFINAFYDYRFDADSPVPYFIAHNPYSISWTRPDNLFLMTPVDGGDLSAGLKIVSSQVLDGAPPMWSFATLFNVGDGRIPYFFCQGLSFPGSKNPNYQFNTAILGLKLGDPALGLEPLYTTTSAPGNSFAAQVAVDGVPFFVTYNFSAPQTTGVGTLVSATTVADGLEWVYSNLFNQVGAIEVVVAFANDPQFIAQKGDQPFLDCARAVARAVENLPNINWPPSLSTIHGKPIGRCAALFIQGDLTDWGGGTPDWGHVWGDKLEQFRQFFEPFSNDDAIQVPVFCGLGNHDLDADDWFYSGNWLRNQMWAYIRDRYAPLIPPPDRAPVPQFVKNIDAIPMTKFQLVQQDYTWHQYSHNYSIQTAGIRFIQVHRFGGDTHYDRAGGLEWLKNELQNAEDDDTCVAVVLLQHFGFNEDIGTNPTVEWTVDQQMALFKTLAHSKMIALFHGHNHAPHPRVITQNPVDAHLYEDLDPGSIKPDQDFNPDGRSIGIARFSLDWERTQLVMDIAMGRASSDGSTIEFGAPDDYVFSNSWDINSRKWISPNPRFVRRLSKVYAPASG